MNSRMPVCGETMRLIETGDLITEREYRQQKAAHAYFRTQLLSETIELQNGLVRISQAAIHGVWRSKY